MKVNQFLLLFSFTTIIFANFLFASPVSIARDLMIESGAPVMKFNGMFHEHHPYWQSIGYVHLGQEDIEKSYQRFFKQLQIMDSEGKSLGYLESYNCQNETPYQIDVNLCYKKPSWHINPEKLQSPLSWRFSGCSGRDVLVYSKKGNLFDIGVGWIYLSESYSFETWDKHLQRMINNNSLNLPPYFLKKPQVLKAFADSSSKNLLYSQNNEEAQLTSQSFFIPLVLNQEWGLIILPDKDPDLERQNAIIGVIGWVRLFDESRPLYSPMSLCN